MARLDRPNNPRIPTYDPEEGEVDPDDIVVCGICDAELSAEAAECPCGAILVHGLTWIDGIEATTYWGHFDEDIWPAGVPEALMSESEFEDASREQARRDALRKEAG